VGFGGGEGVKAGRRGKMREVGEGRVEVRGGRRGREVYGVYRERIYIYSCRSRGTGR